MFFKQILEREIANKIDAYLKSKNSLTDYTLKLKSSGINIEMIGDFEVLDDKHADKVADISVVGVEKMLDKQLKNYDPFHLGKHNNFNFEQVKRTGRSSSGDMLLKSNKPVNPLKLKNLINASLHDETKKLMGRNGRLVYRTGRLARSAFITNIIASSSTNKNLFFTYQHNPYRVFEPGRSSLATAQRDPRKLFGQAITNVLKKLLHKNSLSSTTFNIHSNKKRVGKTIGGVYI